MSKTNWVIVWENKKSEQWQDVNKNMNSIIDFDNFLDTNDATKMKQMFMNRTEKNHLDFSVPANIELTPEMLQSLPIAKKLDGQLFDQFQNESYSYVLQKHVESKYKQNDELVIKEHLYPNIALNETNCKTLNLDHIKKLLEDNSWVGLGTLFEVAQNEFDKLNILSSSVFLTRDKDTHKIVNLSKKRQPNPKAKYLSCVTYVVFKKLSDSNIILGILNPNLITLTHFTNLETEKHKVTTLSNIGSIEEYFLKPKIKKGVLVNENYLFPENGEIELELFGDSPYKYLYENTPRFPYTIKSNVEYEIDQDIVIIKPRKNGYFVIEFVIDSMMKYDFDKKNSKTNKLEYVIFGE